MTNKNSLPTEKEQINIFKKRKFRINNYAQHKITPSECLNKTKQKLWKLHEGLLYLLLLDSTGNYHDDGEIITNIKSLSKLVYWNEIGIDNDKERAKHPLGKLLKENVGKVFEYSIESNKLIEWAGEQPINFPALDIKEKPEAKTKTKTGRPPAYDWDSFFREITLIANKPDGLPEVQADLEKYMAQWALDNWGKQPAESRIRDKISPLYPKADK